jgi:hypothetical protein
VTTLSWRVQGGASFDELVVRGLLHVEALNLRGDCLDIHMGYGPGHVHLTAWRDSYGRVHVRLNDGKLLGPTDEPTRRKKR